MKSKTARNTKASSHSRDSATSLWQSLGDLELAVGSDSDRIVRDWLTTILSPLDLGADFRDKILRSAQEAVTRLILSATAANFEHLHLILFHPARLVSKPQASWGFFRIEKIENAVEGNDNPDHAIEFYLYMEEKQSMD